MINSLVSAILLSPFHWILSIGLAELRVRGRKTNRLYSFPVGYQFDGDAIVILVSHAPTKRWWHNFRDDWPAELVVRGRTVTGTGCRVQPESDEFLRLCEETMRRVPGLSLVFGVHYSRGSGVPDDQLATLRREVVAIRIKPEQPRA